MISFLFKRLLWMALTLWIVFTVSFFLIWSLPGGPFRSERQMSPEVQANMEARFNFDAPLSKQYWDLLASYLHFDFYPSLKLQDYTVSEVIAQGFPISASLGIFALTFAIVLGVLAGVISALRRGTWIDFAFMAIATLGIAIPNFVLASLGIIVFVFLLGWLPAAGWGSIEQLILPAICLGAPFAAYIARLTRTGMLEVLSQDYIKTAQAKGLPARQIVFRHALRGALLPVVSYLGPATAGILTGSLVLERIFAIPGIGSHFIDAATQGDYFLSMGLVMIYTVLLYTMNLLVDISYALIDPRVKLN